MMGLRSDADTNSGTTVRLSERVYASVLRFIADRQLAAGDRLPAERELAEQYSASRPIIREVLSRLASDGLIVSRRGAGSFVRRRPSIHLLANVPTASVSSSLGTYEIRLAVEPEAARLAAVRRTDDEADQLQTLANQLQDALRRGEPSHTIDLSIHRGIAVATKNPMFVEIFDYIEKSVMDILLAGEGVARSEPSQSQRMSDEHISIVDAIVASDSEAAATAMRSHLFEGRKRLFS